MLQAFSTKEILKGDTKDCFKINAKRRIVKPKEDVFVKFKNNENNWKQNPENSYANQYQKHIACSCGYKIVYVHDKISKTFKRYLGGDAVYNLIISMIQKSVKWWKTI